MPKGLSEYEVNQWPSKHYILGSVAKNTKKVTFFDLNKIILFPLHKKFKFDSKLCKLFAKNAHSFTQLRKLFFKLSEANLKENNFLGYTSENY